MPRPLTPRTLSALAVALVLALAGCGGETEDKNAYVDEVNQAQERFRQTVQGLSGKITATSTAAEDRRTLQRYERAIDGVVRDLRGIDAPRRVTAEHGRLVRIMTDYRRDVGRATDDILGRDPDRVLRAQRRLTTASTTVGTRLNEAIDTINRKLRE